MTNINIDSYKNCSTMVLFSLINTRESSSEFIILQYITEFNLNSSTRHFMFSPCCPQFSYKSFVGRMTANCAI